MPEVRELARQIGDGRPCLPFPSLRAARLCAGFIERTSGEQAKVVAFRGIHGVVTSEAGTAALRAFWQHTGLIVSTRQAEAHLAGRAPVAEDEAVRQSLRRQLAGFYDCAEDDVFLAPTGMAAQFAALQAVMQRNPGRPTAQLGFPYVDTLKLQQKLGHGGILLHHLESIESELKDLLRRQPLAACFCEIPGNPLLGSADVRRISPISPRASRAAGGRRCGRHPGQCGPERSRRPHRDQPHQVHRRDGRRDGRRADLQSEVALLPRAQAHPQCPARGSALGRGCRSARRAGAELSPSG